MKLLVHVGTDRVVGAHMVGPDAPEIMQGIAIALKAGATKAIFDSTVGIHPRCALRERERPPLDAACFLCVHDDPRRASSALCFIAHLASCLAAAADATKYRIARPVLSPNLQLDDSLLPPVSVLLLMPCRVHARPPAHFVAVALLWLQRGGGVCDDEDACAPPPGPWRLRAWHDCRCRRRRQAVSAAAGQQDVTCRQHGIAAVSRY